MIYERKSKSQTSNRLRFCEADELGSWRSSFFWRLAPSYLRRMPPSREALRHSGGDSRLFTSAMVTLYFEVELSRERRPGTEQNRSVGLTTHVPPEDTGRVDKVHRDMTPFAAEQCEG